MKRAITPHTPTTKLVADTYSMGVEYRNYRPRGSGDCLLIYTTAGAGRIETRHRVYRLAPGQALLYHPKAYQDYSTDPEVGHWQLSWSHFALPAAWQDLVDWPPWERGTGHLDLGGSALQAQCEDALHEMVQWFTIPQAHSLAQNALHRFLLLCQHHQQRPEQRPQVDARITKAMHYLRENLSEAHSVGALARYVGLSESRLSHLFKATTGETVQSFLDGERMRRARNLLRYSSLRIGEIATRIGYENGYYFSTRFKHHHGLSPRAYREKT